MAMIETKDVVASYDDSQRVKSAVFKRVIEYFKEHKSFHPESIHQMDGPIIDAPNVMSDIAEILSFDVKYKDE